VSVWASISSSSLAKPISNNINTILSVSQSEKHYKEQWQAQAPISKRTLTVRLLLPFSISDSSGNIVGFTINPSHHNDYKQHIERIQHEDTHTHAERYFHRIEKKSRLLELSEDE